MANQAEAIYAWNKYISPDFDPSLLKKDIKYGARGARHVRMVTPFKCTCLNCGAIIPHMKKFNTRIEKATDKDYHGVVIFRFFYRCPECSQAFTIVTDPATNDYAAEHGVRRNVELWKEKYLEKLKEKEEKEARDQLGGVDTMEALEDRTERSKRLMEYHEELEALKTQNREIDAMSPEEMLQQLYGSAESATAGAASAEGGEVAVQRTAAEEAELAVAFGSAPAIRGSEVNVENRISVLSDRGVGASVGPSLPGGSSSASFDFFGEGASRATAEAPSDHMGQVGWTNGLPPPGPLSGAPAYAKAGGGEGGQGGTRLVRRKRRREGLDGGLSVDPVDSSFGFSRGSANAGTEIGLASARALNGSVQLSKVGHLSASSVENNKPVLGKGSGGVHSGDATDRPLQSGQYGKGESETSSTKKRRLESSSQVPPTTDQDLGLASGLAAYGSDSDDSEDE